MVAPTIRLDEGGEPRTPRAIAPLLRMPPPHASLVGLSRRRGPKPNPRLSTPDDRLASVVGDPPGGQVPNKTLQSRLAQETSDSEASTSRSASSRSLPREGPV